MKVFVLGATGMLGSYLKKFLETKYTVIALSRNELDAAQTSQKNIEQVLINHAAAAGDIIINAVGTIKPRVDELGELNAILVNSVFPHLLSSAGENLQVKMIHITTDCVFTGFRGQYDENDVHDISDVYGRTKSLGEPANCSNIRTSIIGEEKNNQRSLIEWIKANKGKEVFGFTNHQWNGVTCLQLAKLIDQIIAENLFWKGVRHIHSPRSLNKLELVKLVSDVYQLNMTVLPKETPVKCDRTLTTLYPTFTIPDLAVQLEETRNFTL
jgi:dTDP-4-dehydrorhamnose reductase